VHCDGLHNIMMSNDVSKTSIQDNPILKNTGTEIHFIHYINRWELLHDALSNDLYIWKGYVENSYHKICNNRLYHVSQTHKRNMKIKISKYTRKTRHKLENAISQTF
jgi:hypothetical protein